MQDLTTNVQRLRNAVEGPHGLERRMSTIELGVDTTNSSSQRPSRPLSGDVNN